MNFLFFRFLKRSWSTAIINVAGLTMGLSLFVLLAQWIQHELSYDEFHVNGAHIYRPSMNINFGGQKKNVSRAQAQLLPWLQKNFPEIEKGTRFYNPSRSSPFVVRNGDKLYEERKFYYADSTFFDVFSFPLLKGNPQTALREPRSVVLTKKMALKYFGDIDPLGKGIEVNDEGEYVVKGIAEDIPSNSFLQPEFLASFSSLPVSRDPSWGPAFYETYVVIEDPGHLETIQLKTNEMVAQLFRDETSSPGDYVKYDFMPFRGLYLASHVLEGETTGSLQAVYLFGCVALVVLLVAGVNYINLSTALAASRAKEMTVKKIAGASRSLLVRQILTETAFITLVVFVLVFMTVHLSLPAFNEITGKQLTLSDFYDEKFLIAIGVLYFSLTLLIGAYPAFIMTSFQPVMVLKGNFKSSEKGVTLRKWLLTFQFSVSIALIAFSIVIVKQMHLLHHQGVGYDKEHTVILPFDSKTESVYSSLRKEMIRGAGVTNVARSTETPIKISSAVSINIEGESAVRQVLVNVMAIDTAFLECLRIPLMQGRNFTDADIQSTKHDTTFFFIFNESAVKAVLPGETNVIGKRIDMDGLVGEVVGVMKDFNFGPLHQPITPLVFYPDDSNFRWMYLRLKPEGMTDAIDNMRKVYQTQVPHRPFEFHFLDEQYNAQYAKEERTAVICNFFSALTIGISFVGLIGLIAYTVSARNKELAMRKVLGASTWNMIDHLFSEFKTILIVSILTGSALAFWIGTDWLDQFAYKVGMDAIPILVSVGICLSLVLVVILFQVFSVMRRNAAMVLAE